MTREELMHQFKVLAAEQVGTTIDEIKEDSTPADMGFDDLDCVELIMAMEDEVDTQVHDLDETNWENVAEVLDAFEAVL